MIFSNLCSCPSSTGFQSPIRLIWLWTVGRNRNSWTEPTTQKGPVWKSRPGLGSLLEWTERMDWSVEFRCICTTHCRCRLDDTSIRWNVWLIYFPYYLAVCIDNWSQKFPCSTSAVHSNHPQNLKESKRPDGWSGKNIPLSSRSQNWDRRYQHHDVCQRERDSLTYITFTVCLPVYSLTCLTVIFLFLKLMDSPITQKGFLANLRRPCHPL